MLFMRSEMNIIVIDRDEYVTTRPCVFLAHNSLPDGERERERQREEKSGVIMSPTS